MIEYKHRQPAEHFVHSGWFALRTPFLPVRELTAWSRALTASKVRENDEDALKNAWLRDVRELRSCLRGIITRPEMLHSLYVASPSLQGGIEHWKRDPDSKKGIQAERALVRYFVRMAARCTPFGLFSGYSVGRIEDKSNSTTLLLGPRSKCRLSCRLDFDYLFALTTALRRDPALEMELCYRPNSSLHKIASAWYYTESRLAEKERTHHLVKILTDEYLEAVIGAAQNGATVSQLVKAVLKAPGDADPSEAEAQQYVLDLIRENEILVSNLSPLLTGTPPLEDLISTLESLPSGGAPAAILRDVRSRISCIESAGINCTADEYKGVTAQLEKLPAKFDSARLFQVDMVKPVERAVLGTEVISELLTGVDILRCLGQTSEPEELRNFREAFSARYEMAMVPLLDALDEESGVGFGANANKNDASPLLRGLHLREGENASWRSKQLGVDDTLFQQVVECLAKGGAELELDLSQLHKDAGIEVKIADAFCVMGTLVATSPEKLREGDFEFYLHGGVGPSGARLLGRFCHADAEIERGVRRHLQQEELHDPEAIYAEVVYLPEGRVGNVLCRPVLRAYEIPYLGRSGAAQDRQLPVSDLWVRIESNDIVLYSRRLQRRIIPRLTNAHGFMNPQLSAVYRFLCCLQHQHGTSVPAFSWGALEALSYLPRARVGRTVLAAARWRLSEKEVKAIGGEEGSRRFAAVQKLRRQRALPRWVVFQEGDNYLPVDLENALTVDAFVHALKRGSTAILVEMYPSPEQICVSAPEGAFHHELNVPFVRKVIPRNADIIHQKPSLEFEGNTGRKLRILPPGSEWLYLKLYGGTGALDEILVAAVSPLVRSLSALEYISRWFFIRYADPHDHLRIRFNCKSENIVQQVSRLARETFNPLLASGMLWKIEFDTYQREVERYGGMDGVLAAEDIFCSDSDAALDILRQLSGDEGLDIRWRAAIMGIDRLLSDLGLDAKEKLDAAHKWREMSQSEFKVGMPGRRQLGDRFRTERQKLVRLLEDSPEPGNEWDFAQQSFARRSTRNLEPCRRLRELAAQGKLTLRMTDLAASYVHMHVNRLIRASQRAHELVLYDFLAQLYDSRLARKTSTPTAVAAQSV
jgi:thiopeptide-type bacteriocin biosynthesis protein